MLGSGDHGLNVKQNTWNLTGGREGGGFGFWDMGSCSIQRPFVPLVVSKVCQTHFNPSMLWQCHSFIVVQISVMSRKTIDSIDLVFGDELRQEVFTP